jgi:hypothetical protein
MIFKLKKGTKSEVSNIFSPGYFQKLKALILGLQIVFLLARKEE